MRSIRTPGGRMLEWLIWSTSCSTRRMVGELCSPRRISTMPCTMSSSSSWPAMPRRGAALLDVGDIAHEGGGSARRRHDRVANGVHGLNERDPAYDRGVLAEIQGLSADVQIVVVES